MAGEKKIENQIKKYLDSIGAWYIKIHGSAFTKVGIPDIIGCYKGLFFAIEVKDTGKKTSLAQDVHIDNILKAGGIAFRADNLEDVKKRIKEADKV